jgi:hypothetical protein
VPKLRLALVLTAAVLTLPATAGTRVPHGFIGMNADGPLLTGQVNLDAQMAAMARGGVESVRTSFYWSAAQPVSSWIYIDPSAYTQYTDIGGVPTSFAATDALVRAAASHRIGVLPVVWQAPGWAALHPGNPSSPPSNGAAYANYLVALVQRYGPKGTFWTQNPTLPKIPIRDWQIWNEPDSTKYWSDQPFVPGYAALLKAAHGPLKKADRGARAVLAGFPSRSWVSLARLYAAGAKRYFDVAAVHPFSLPVSNIPRILVQDRRVMAKFHDAKKPFFVTETSWPSAKGKTSTKYGFEVTQSGQAAKAKAVLSALASARKTLKVERLYWYTWISLDSSTDAPFDYAGLQKLMPNGTLVQKPAFGAFTRTALKLEGCRSKTSSATSCRK